MKRTVFIFVVGFSLAMLTLSCRMAREVKQFTGHTGNIRCVAFSPDGRRALSGSEDGTMRLWDIETGKEIRRFEGMKIVTCLAFSPDGRRGLSGSSDSTYRVWDLEKGTEIRRFTGQTDSIMAVAFSPDGRAISATYNTIFIGEVQSGQEAKCEIRGFITGPTNAESVPGWFCLAFSRDGRFAVGQGEDRALHLMDLKEGRQLRRFVKARQDLECVAFSNDGRYVMSGTHTDGLAQLWDAKAGGSEIRTFKDHKGSVLGLDFSPDGRRAVSSDGSGWIHLWDLESGRETAVLQGHDSPIWSVAFSPDGKQLLSGGGDKIVHLWKLP